MKDNLAVRLQAYHLFMLGHGSNTIARRLKISPRTVRLWSAEEKWPRDRSQLYALVRGLVVVDLLRGFAAEQAYPGLVARLQADDQFAISVEGKTAHVPDMLEIARRASALISQSLRPGPGESP